VSWQPKPRNTYTNSYDSQPGLQSMNRKIKAQLRALALVRVLEQSGIWAVSCGFFDKAPHNMRTTFAKIA